MCVCAYKRMCLWTFAYRLSRFCNTILSGALFLLLSIIIAQSPGVRQEDIVLRGVRVYLRPSTADEVMRASIRQWRFATVCDVNHGREWIYVCMQVDCYRMNEWMYVCKWECVYLISHNRLVCTKCWFIINNSAESRLLMTNEINNTSLI